LAINGTGILNATDDEEADTLINTEGNVTFAADSTFTMSDSTITFDATSGTDDLTTNGKTIYNLAVDDGGGGSLVVEVESDLDINGSIAITDGTLDVTTNNRSINVGGSWTNGDIFTARAGTVTFDSGDASETVNGGSSAFNNVDFNGSGGGWTTNGAVDVDGTFDLTVGSLTQGADNSINVAGDFTVADGTTFTKASGTGLIILDGDLVLSDNSTVKQDLGNIQIGTSPDTTYLGADLKANSVTVATGDTLFTDGFEMDIGPNGITVEGTGTLNVTDADNNSDTKFESDTTLINTTGDFDIQAVGGTFTDTDGDSTLTFDAASGTDNITTSGESLSNLVVDGTSVVVEIQDVLDVDKNLIITSGELDTKSGVSNSITVGGNWDNDDIFTAQSGTVTFDGAAVGAETNTIDSTGATLDDFNNITFNDAADGDTFQLESALDVNGNVLITGGTLDTKTGEDNSINVAGNWTNNDTFSHFYC